MGLVTPIGRRGGGSGGSGAPGVPTSIRAWDSATTFTTGQGTTRNGSEYLAVADNVNVDPATDDGSHWLLIVAKGQDGTNSSGSGGSVFKPILGPVPVTTRPWLPSPSGKSSDWGSTVDTIETWLVTPMPAGAAWVRFRFLNGYTANVTDNSTFTDNLAAVQYEHRTVTSDGRVVTTTFGGTAGQPGSELSPVVQPGQWIDSDPVLIEEATGAQTRQRLRVTANSGDIAAGKIIACNSDIRTVNGESVVTGAGIASQLDQPASVSTVPGSQNPGTKQVCAPVACLAESFPQSLQYAPTICLGDSRMSGQKGYIQTAMYAAGVPYVTVGRAQETGGGFTNFAGPSSVLRRAVLPNAFIGIFNYYINDAAATLTQNQWDKIETKLKDMLRRRGCQRIIRLLPEAATTQVSAGSDWSPSNQTQDGTNYAARESIRLTLLARAHAGEQILPLVYRVPSEPDVWYFDSPARTQVLNGQGEWVWNFMPDGVTYRTGADGTGLHMTDASNADVATVVPYQMFDLTFQP